MDDDPRPGRSKIRNLIRSNRRLTIREMADELNSIFTLLSQVEHASSEIVVERADLKCPKNCLIWF